MNYTMTEEEANVKVFLYENIQLTRRELEILKGPRFVNDVIIQFYFLHITNHLLESHESLKDDILLVLPAISYLLQQDFGDDSHIQQFAESNDVASKQVVMFTVNNNSDGGNDGGSHWSLLVYYRKSNMFVHYDSLGTNGHFARKLFRAVKKYMAPQTESSTTNMDVEGEVATTSSSTPTVEEDMDFKDTCTAIIGDLDSTPNTSLINGIQIGDMEDSKNTSMDLNGDSKMSTSIIDGDSEMSTSIIDGDSKIERDSTLGGDSTTTTSMTNIRNIGFSRFASSSSRVICEDYSTGFYGPPEDYCSRFDWDDDHMQQWNVKKLMRRSDDEEEDDLCYRYGSRRRDRRNPRLHTLWDMDPHRRHMLFPRRGLGWRHGNYHNNVYYDEKEYEGFKEEKCMPKQKNFTDCGLYVMKTAEVVCRWYYLDEEAKQRGQDHGAFCELGGDGRFPNMDQYVDTSLESTMRRDILSNIEFRAAEAGRFVYGLFSSDESSSGDDERPVMINPLSTRDVTHSNQFSLDGVDDDDYDVKTQKSQSIRFDDDGDQMADFEDALKEFYGIADPAGAVVPPQSVSSSSTTKDDRESEETS